MDTRRTRSLSRATLASAMALACLSAPALAQNAQVATCNLKGTVTLTVAGIPTHLPLACVNGTEQTTPGTDTSVVAGTTTLGIPAVANLASVSAPFGESIRTDSPNATVLTGDAGASDVSLLQGGVATSDVAGRLTCTVPTANSPTHCTAAMTIGTVAIGGLNIPIPAEPVPINTVIPISNLNVAVQVAGIGLVNVPLNGALTLNKVTVTGEGTLDARIEHAPISVSVSGSAHLLGVPLVSLDITLDDYTALQAQIFDTHANPTLYLDE